MAGGRAQPPLISYNIEIDSLKFFMLAYSMFSLFNVRLFFYVGPSDALSFNIGSHQSYSTIFQFSKVQSFDVSSINVQSFEVQWVNYCPFTILHRLFTVQFYTATCVYFLCDWQSLQFKLNFPPFKKFISDFSRTPTPHTAPILTPQIRWRGGGIRG